MSIDVLNPKFTFDNFVVGHCNQFAYAAAQAIVDKFPQQSSPLFIHGRVGTGKTHLLHAITHSMKTKDGLRVVFETSESFKNQCIHAIRFDKFPEFRKTQMVDILLIDDIHFLAGAERNQEVLYWIFDHFLNSQKQIVITSNSSPREITGFSKEICSLFERSLVIQLDPPDINTRITTLEKLAADYGVILPPELTLFMVTKINPQSGIRPIVGALNRLIAYASIRGVPLSVMLAEDVLLNLINPEDLRALDTHVQVVDASPQIIEMLRKDYSYIHQLSPEGFEQLICDRLSKMGFEVKQVGSTYSRDGGVDIIAWPSKPTPFPYLLATQVKHHNKVSRKTGPGAVKDLQSVIASQPFHAGLLVTNTSFTPDARWFANHRSHILRLRDMEDLRRWIWDIFTDEAESREIPSSIELAPGLIIDIPTR